ncbi:hypothetical protein M0R45_010270 [Rubus argutus]|uniref:Uncharacterized protein n=1 Tax=Rubus argutus TaxID=59490 RepID=A0AAW1Y930_RUBAR
MGLSDCQSPAKRQQLHNHLNHHQNRTQFTPCTNCTDVVTSQLHHHICSAAWITLPSRAQPPRLLINTMVSAVLQTRHPASNYNFHVAAVAACPRRAQLPSRHPSQHHTSALPPPAKEGKKEA